MRFYITTLIILINIILQSTFLQHFKIFGIIPNTSLIIVISFALIWGNKNGALIGLGVGLMQDILGGTFLGLNAVIYLLVGYNLGIFQRILFKDSYLTPILFAGVSTVLYYFMLYFICIITGIDIQFGNIIKSVLPIEVIYNSIMAVIIYRIIYYITNKPFMNSKLRR